MEPWIPFFQSIIWPLIIIVIFFFIGKDRFQNFIEATTERIKKGQGPVRLPGGIELPEMPIESGTPDEILKAEAAIPQPQKEKLGLVETSQLSHQMNKKEPSPMPEFVKNEILKSQVEDWSFLVLTNWVLIDPLVTSTITIRYVFPSRKEEIAKKSISDRIGMLSAPEYQMPLDLLSDLRTVSGVVERHKTFPQNYNEETIKQLKDAYFRLERLRQFFFYRLFRGP